MAAVRVRVWDLPTRLFHWALTLCVIGSIASINIGGNAVEWHFRFGYAILTLLLFRLLWGFVGPRYARFASFAPNPLAAWRYLRGRAAAGLGHNPLGALSVYALLLSLAVQAGTGLFASDAIIFDGPLRPLVSGETGDWLTAVHKVNKIILIVLVVLHLLAIAWYAIVRKQRLVGPMIVGDKLVEDARMPAPAAADGARERMRALVLLVVCALVVWALVTKLV
ncbi:MAG: cytochrome b/b6 domain-containing protein [Burkholderiales bacterium]|nr:cytochrome b/b6 domain-containing protein [Burkholderiales bacterium]